MAGPIRIDVDTDAARAASDVDRLSRSTSSLGDKARKLAKVAAVGLAVAGAAAVKFGIDSVKSASDAQQSLGATRTVFGKYADDVIKRSEAASRAVGLSANEYRELANVTGASLSATGMPLRKVAGLTDDLNKRAADLAATFGGTTKDAVGAIGSLLRGEADPIEAYGVSIKESDVSARLAAKGLDQLTGSALKQAQMQARLDLLFQQTTKSQGAFKRESGTLAHQQQVLAAQWEDLKAKVGTALLPVLTQLVTWVNDKVIPALTVFGGKAAELWQKIQPAIAAVRGWIQSLSGSGQANAKLEEVRQTVARVWGSIKSIFSSAVTIVTALWRRFGGIITDTAGAHFSAMLRIVRGAFKVLEGIFNLIAGVLTGDWKRAWTGIKQIAGGAWDVITGMAKSAWAVLKGIVRVGLSAVKGIFTGGWDLLKQIVSAAWDKITSAVSSGVSRVVTFVKGLPGKITAALGNLGSLLLDAGGQIIQGLLDGITSKIGSVRSKLGELTGMIPDWKGPRRRDRRLLRDAGRQIIRGLVDGFTDESPGVKKSLGELTKRIQRAVDKRYDGKAVKRHTRDVLSGLREEYRALRKNGQLQDRITEQLVDARKAAADYAKSVAGAAVSYASITSADTAYNAGAITAGMQGRLDKLRQFGALIDSLRGQGLNATTLDQLVQGGVEGGLAYAQALAEGGRKAVREVNSLQSQIGSVSKQLGASATKGVNQGVVDGLETKQARVDRAAKRLARRLAVQVRRELAQADVLSGVGRSREQRRREAERTARADRSRREKQEIRLHLTADVVDQVQRGKRVQRDLDAARLAGGRSRT